MGGAHPVLQPVCPCKDHMGKRMAVFSLSGPDRKLYLCHCNKYKVGKGLWKERRICGRSDLSVIYFPAHAGVRKHSVSGT